MCNTLKLPQVKAFVERLGRVNYREMGTRYAYDEQSYVLIDQIYELIQKIQPVGKYGHRELWLPAHRGTIEDFAASYGSFEDMVEWGEIATQKEYEKYWQSEFPYETEWFEVVIAEDKDIDYRAIFINNKHVIEVDGQNADRQYPHDISDFCRWLLDALQDAILELKNGSYNARVEAELPYNKRFGTLRQEQFWELYPEEKSEFFKNLTEEEKQVFLQFADSTAVGRLPKMTANQFYEACALGYKANGHRGCELPSKEQYKLHADGRDDGLSELDPDAPEAFERWYHSGAKGGHPWEVVRGGNSTHISLYVCHDDAGWYFLVAGSAYGRTIETVQFFLGLYKAGLPAAVRDAYKLKERLLGTELVGIVPEFIIPKYCHSYFEKDGCISFMHLDYDEPERMAALCNWYPITEVKLLEKGVEGQ